ncbi:hypothetical protein QBC35DRAFT_423317, partial [Podospora australis]
MKYCFYFHDWQTFYGREVSGVWYPVFAFILSLLFCLIFFLSLISQPHRTDIQDRQARRWILGRYLARQLSRQAGITAHGRRNKHIL